MNVLPQETLYGINQRFTMLGKLNGGIMQQTPKGCRISISSMERAISSNIVPCINEGIPVATSTFSIPRRISPRASSIVFPSSTTIVLDSSSKFSSIRSFNVKRYRTRVSGGVSRHSKKASFAACMADSTSSGVENGTSAICSVVAGFITSRISVDSDSTH